MQTNFVEIVKEFKPELNFWELNPQIRYIEPFNEVYELDKGKEESSNIMWVTFFMCDPDNEKNKFYRYKIEERKKFIEENFYPDVDWESELLVKSMEAYPQKCLTAIQKALKEEIDSMTERAKVLRETEYTVTKTEIINNKAVRITGTAKELDDARAKTISLYENYRKLEEEFFQEKASTRVRGGRTLTKAETGEI